MPALLEVDGLQVAYGGRGRPVRAVDGTSFAIGEGSIVGLVGESGCGKTTAARAITGVLPRSARILGGAVRFAGRDLIGLDDRGWSQVRWREIAFVPQSAMNALDPVYRVGSQLVEVLAERGGLGRAAARARAAELFGMVGLDARRLDDFPHQLSGGMRQRTAIALALALKPKLVIADEPVTALDVIVQRQVLDTLLRLQRELGLSVLLVTHDISVVAYACDQMVVMYAGQVVEAGPTAAVLGRPFHPYSMGLTNAFPDLERAAGLLVPIEGSPPDLAEPPPGCRFEPRCPFALGVCAERPCAVAAAEAGHDVACWRAGEAAALRDLAKEAATWTRS